MQKPTPPSASGADEPASTSSQQSDPDATTKKWGLEAGLYKVATDKDGTFKSKGEQAKQLLKTYGSAYLLTSISLAIVSFGACYTLINAGVDVGTLLAKLGIQVTTTNEQVRERSSWCNRTACRSLRGMQLTLLRSQVGTFALAYAAHKALSPVRFPPTVALTPVVARYFGKKSETNDESAN